MLFRNSATRKPDQHRAGTTVRSSPDITYLDRPVRVLVQQASSWRRATAVALRDGDRGEQMLVDLDDHAPTRMGRWIDRPRVRVDVA